MRRKIWILSLSLMLAACSGVKNQSAGSGGSTSGSSSGGSGGSGGSTGSGGSSVSQTGLSVSPGVATIAIAATVSLHAMGKFSDGSSKDQTATATWSSSDTNVATVSAAGVVTGVTTGVVSITAHSGSFTGSSLLTVNSAAANLTSIEVGPAGSSLPVNTTQQMTATGVYSDGSNRDLTAVVTWTSSTIANATVDAGGLVTAVAAGSSTITATLGSVMGSTSVTVTAPSITSISIAPDDMTLAIGVGQQYVASAIYSDGSIQDLVSGVTWTSSSASVATIDNSGLATTLAAGATTITATVGSFTDSSTITVVPAHLLTITLTPATASMAPGTQQQFTATGNFDDGSTQVLTSALWSSSSAGVLTIDQNGLGLAVGPGTSTVSVVSGTVSATTSVTVTSATLVSLAISPLNSTMPVGAIKAFTATGTFSDSSTQDMTLSVLWSSSAPAVATIDDTGSVTSLATGTTTIGAAWGSITQSATLTVSAVKLVSITISPNTPRVEKGTSLKFTAIGNYSDGSTATLATVSWRSSKNNLANMRKNGILHAKKAGTLALTASAFGATGSTTVTIGTGALVSVDIQPANSSVTNGSTQQFAAIGTFSDGSTQDVTINSHWSSTVPTVATVANAPVSAGLATTHGTGTTTIGVNHGGITASTPFSSN